MLEKLHEYLKRNHDYELKEYAHFEVPYKRSILIPIGLGLFGATIILYIVDRAIDWGRINLFLVILSFVLFVLVPFATKKANKYSAIIVTPELLIQRLSRNEFTAVRFDDVTSFKLTEHGIYVKDDQNTVALSLSMLRTHIDTVIDILEAKGKTFDPEKEYMIRKVKIHIEDNKVTLEDIHEVTDFDLLYQKLSPDYAMLTPGFIETIIFRNASVTNCCTVGADNMSLQFDRLEIKEGHPENTKFESIIAQDTIVVFHDSKLKMALLKNLHDKDEADQDLGKQVDEIQKHLVNAVVTEWKVRKSAIDFIFATGVHTLTLKLSYKNVIVGWNKTKE